MPSVAIELAPDAKAEVVEGLTKGVAETAIVTLKAQFFHWNVTGPSFGPLHDLFQEIYEDHFEGQDDLAERIKQLDAHAIGSYAEFLELSSISESKGAHTPEEMIKDMMEAQVALSSTMNALAVVADSHGDIVTNDMAIERANKHDKFAWFLRAQLQ